ncbi:hypothetical protein GH131_10410 [Staphylococcus pseudintermedius]|nr:hypothetical protein [Staphylococcus pseudintermedius]
MNTFFNFNINVKLRILCGFFTSLFNVMVNPFMAVFFSEYYPVSTVGVIIFIGMFLVILSNFYGGQIADTYNRKKILVTGIYLNGSALLIIGFLIKFNVLISMIVLIYWMNMFFSNIYKPSLSSLIIEITTDDDRRKIFTYNYWFSNLALALGVAIGGIYFSKYNDIMYLLIGLATLLIGCIYSIFIQNNYRPLKIKKREGILKNYISVLKDYKFTLFVLSGALIFSNELHITNFVSVNLKNKDVINYIGNLSFDAFGSIAFLQILNTLVIVLFTILVNKYTKGASASFILILGLCIYSISYSFTLLTTNLLLLAVAVIFASLGELIFAPIYQTKQVELMSSEKFGVYSAVSSIFTQCAPLVASLYLLISEYINWISFFLLAFSINIFSIVCIYFIQKNRRPT